MAHDETWQPLVQIVPAPYATTIHKSQGSEYPAVVIPLTTQHYPMLRRNLIYTALTRGKRLIVIVGQKKAMANLLKGSSLSRRWSKLKNWRFDYNGGHAWMPLWTAPANWEGRDMECLSCHAENLVGRRFCSRCGEPLPVTCARCGFANDVGDAFCGGCGAALTSAASLRRSNSCSQPISQMNDSIGAERRQLTIMFCDLVGSTALSLQLDPEDVREIVKHVQETCARIIGQYDGFIAKYMGDGILVYFGYPQAHEDDVARAVRSGLAIVDAIRARGTMAAERFGAQVAVRVGIATGLVVAGDLIGEGASQEKAVVGSTPNLAARLQGLAAPNSVVIASTTRQVLGSEFDLENLGRHELKGFSQPEQAWRVVGVRTAPTRFEATHASGLTPLVGREAEIDLILHRWRHQAVNREGQLVLLSGEPGIGKSRLIEAIRECLAGEAYFHIRYQCSPYFANSAFYPVVEQLRLAAGLARDDDDEHRLEKIEAMLALAIADVRQVAPLFAALMEISTGDRYPCLALSPVQQKERTVSALLEQLQGLARQQPVLFVVEDMQWIDPSTLDLVDRVIERIEGLPVLCLASSRPDFAPPWIGRPQVTQLFLSRMNRQQCAAIIGRLIRGKKLPPEIEQEIIAKTDGIPLFIEELTKTVLEAGFLDEKADAYQPTTTRPAFTVPTTLRNSLMARLDRLGSAKAVAQTGAVIGRTFSLELLAAASGVPTNILEASLAQLVRAELIQQRGVPPLAIYTFGHALIQEVAYQSLLKSRRRHLHAKIARALERHFPEVGRTKPELLAHHATEAGLVELAIGYWQRAGERAAERSANKEAVAHLQKGLELIRLLPEGEAQRQRELDLLVALGVPLRAVKGISAKEVGECYERARQLCEEIGAVKRLFPVLWGLWAFFRGRGEMPMISLGNSI